MKNKKCTYIAKCLFFNSAFLPDMIKEILVKRYCLGEFEKCERKKLMDRNEKVPDNMTPDGRFIALRNGK
jgi:hypothetical protein